MVSGSSLAGNVASCIFTAKPSFTLKRFWKIVRTTLFTLLMLVVLLWILIQLPPVQNWMADYAAKRLSKALQTKVQVKNVSFTLLNKVNLEGLYIEDRQKDTLLSAGELQLNLNDWFIFKDSIDLKYLGLKDARIYLQRSSDTVWNYQFITDYFSGNKKKKTGTPADTTGQKVTLSITAVDMNNVVFEMRDRWKGNTQYIGIDALQMQARSADPAARLFDIDELRLTGPKYMSRSYKGNWRFEDSVAWRRRVDAQPPGGFPENPGNIQLHIAKVTLTDGFFQLRNNRAVTELQDLFDTRNIILSNINGTATNLRWNRDTLSFHAGITGGAGNSFMLKKLETDFTFQPQLMELKSLDLQLANTHITDYFSMSFKNTDAFSNFTEAVVLKADFKNATVSTNDLAYFASGLKDIHQLYTLNGLVSGTLDDLASQKLQLTAGSTKIDGALHLQSLTTPSRLYIDFTTPGSTLHLKDIQPWAPVLSSLPAGIKQALQPLYFKGSFKGLVKDFAIDGTLKMPQGNATTHMKLNLNNNTYAGQIRTDDLNLGDLLGVDKLGEITFDGNVKGKGFDINASLAFDGRLQRALYNGYTYQNVNASGEIRNRVLTSNLNLADPNLQGKMDVTVNLQKNTRAYIGSGSLTTANFRTLNLTKQDLRFSGTFDINFTGETIDDFLGYARLYNAHLYDGDRPFSFDSLIVYSTINPEGKKELSVQTNEVDASVVGKFNIAGLPNSFQYFLSNYYPTLIAKPKTVAKNQDFIFAVNVKNIELYLQLFNPAIEGLDYSSITGIINTTDNQLILNATVPFFKYNHLQISNANLQATGTDRKLNVYGTLDEFRMSDSLSFPNATLNLATENEVSHIQVNTSRGGLVDEAAITADLTTAGNSLKLQFNPSTFILNNKKWTIEQGGELLMQNKQLLADNLVLRQDNQEIRLNSLAPEEGSNNELQIQTANLNIGDLLPYVLKQPQLEGLVTGNFIVVNPLGGKPVIRIDSLRLEQARMNGDSIGLLTAKGEVDLTSGRIRATVHSPNENYRFDADVQANLYDSTGNQLDVTLNLKRERLSILQGYLSTIFDTFDGYATGLLRIKGKAGSPQLIGDITIMKGEIKVAYTQVTYYIDSALIRLQPDGMDFGTIKIRDRFNNTGIVQGGFKHNFFQNMVFDLSVKSDKMELVNTTLRNNQTFYGQAVGRGSYELKGPGNNLTMNISAEPTDSSHVFIPNSSTARESSDADFIVFKKYGREQTAPAATATNLHINVDIKVNNKTQVDVILDYANNDVITAWGNGNLAISYNNDAFTMKGRYDVEKGSYNYNFQSFIRKPFDLTGDGSNYIEWVSGDPLDANLHVNAVYTATNVRFSDLNANNNFTLGNNSLRGNVQVNATISGKLLKPKIDFDIDLPQNSDIRNDPSAQLALERINKDESERLKQVTYLIVFNQFAPYGGASGIRNPGADLAFNTITEILSRVLGNVLSNVLYQITGDRSLQVDFSTSVYNSNDVNTGTVSATNYDRQRVNLKLGKSLANNRIVINVGSDFDFSYNASSVNSFQFLPDISVEFILSNDRKLRAILFKRDNLELGSRRNRAGASISFRQDFDHFFRNSKDNSAATIHINSHGNGIDSTHLQPNAVQGR